MHNHHDEDSGAFEVHSFDWLTTAQKDVAVRVLLRIYEISDAEAARERSDAGEYKTKQHTYRPRNVFLLDGPRGSGKTTLLLTIRHHAELMGDIKAWSRETSQGGPCAFLNEVRREIAARVGREGKGQGGTKEGVQKAMLLFRDGHAAGGPSRKTACALKVLFPSDLEGMQPIMEGLFSLMDAQLDAEIEALGRAGKGRDRDRDKDRDAARLDELRAKLYDDVAKGWYLSQREGDEAILRDSFDLDEYLNKRGLNSGRSYQRVTKWREFVNEFLDALQCQSLVVCFDDTDVTPEVTADMLHTIRIFLDHPRIITLVAGHLKSMRQILVRGAIGDLRQPLAALSGPDSMTARAWRSFQRHQVEEYLEKILPRYQRYFLKLNDVPAKDGKNPNSDLGKYFDNLAHSRLRHFREDFLRAKWDAHFNYLNWRAELPNEKAERNLDAYLAWWLFRHWYNDRLRPRTLRQLKVLERFLAPAATAQNGQTSANATGELPLSALMGNASGKRLPVILFESPDNYRLIQEFDDSDSRVMEWLRYQDITSSWRGQRFIDVNGQHMHAGTYSYAFLLFRVDLAMMMPLRENSEAHVPPGMLPKHSGPDLSGKRPFYVPKGERPIAEQRFGVNSVLRHSLTPSNCIYFHDLRAMPELAWHDGHNDLEWETPLTYTLEEKFFREREGMVLDSTSGASAAKDRAYRYLFDVVVPIASLEINDFIEPGDGAGNDDDLLLRAESDKGMFSAARETIQSARRRFDYLGRLAAGPTSSEAVTNEVEEILQNQWRDVSNRLFKDPAGFKGLTARRMEQYRWLVNDVRRAFHALRVYGHQSAKVALPERTKTQDPATGKAEPPGEEQADHRAGRRKPFVPHLDRYTIASPALIERFIAHTEDCKRVWIKWSLPIEHMSYQGAVTEMLSSVQNKLQGDAPESGESGVPPGGLGAPKPNRLRALASFDHWFNTERPLAPGGNGVEQERLPLAALMALDMFAHDANSFVEYRRAFKQGSENEHRDCGRRIDLFDASETSVGKLQILRDEKVATRFIPIDVAVGSTAGDDGTGSSSFADEARIARYLLTLFWALGPCLPSLIHIDIAADEHAITTGALAETGCEEAKREKLKAWLALIQDMTRFTRRYRAVSEIARIRMDLTACFAGKSAYEDHGVRLTLYPDASFTSLGVRGLQDEVTRETVLELMRLGGEQASRLNNRMKITAAQPRTEFRGIIDSLEEHLHRARKFIEEIGDANARGAGDADKPAAGKGKKPATGKPKKPATDKPAAGDAGAS